LITIYFKCSCSINAEQRKLVSYKNKEGLWKTRFECEEHKAIVSKVILTCSVCNKQEEISTAQLNRKKCKTCSIQQKIQRLPSITDMKLHMFCGCVLNQSDTIVRNHKRVCPTHIKTLEKITFTCPACKKKITTITGSLRTQKVCKTCRQQRFQEIDQARHEKQQKIILKEDPILGRLQPVRYQTCVNYNKCLEFAAYNNKKLKCRSCKFFKEAEVLILANTDFSQFKKRTKYQKTM
jgi:hypothetical protein